jgi:hypothetical protein
VRHQLNLADCAGTVGNNAIAAITDGAGLAVDGATAAEVGDDGAAAAASCGGVSFGGASFAAGTKVVTATGASVAISTLRGA